VTVVTAARTALAVVSQATGLTRKLFTLMYSPR
jgi:hypothetical protein